MSQFICEECGERIRWYQSGVYITNEIRLHLHCQAQYIWSLMRKHAIESMGRNVETIERIVRALGQAKTCS